jgi:hypothetical protein
VYQAAQASEPSGEGATGEPGAEAGSGQEQEEVVEADYEIVDDDSKS